MKLLCFYVPLEHCEAVKEAVFKAGGGRFGDYRSCAWQCKGRGQFIPQSNSQPFIGQPGVASWVDEFKVEITCSDHCVTDCINAMIAAHPYETPAYHVISVTNTAKS
jgi:hypothetical protein